MKNNMHDIHKAKIFLDLYLTMHTYVSEFFIIFEFLYLNVFNFIIGKIFTQARAPQYIDSA